MTLAADGGRRDDLNLLGGAIALPDVRERLAAAALEPVPQSTDQFRTLIDEELTRWARVIRDANIRTE